MLARSRISEYEGTVRKDAWIREYGGTVRRDAWIRDPSAVQNVESEVSEKRCSWTSKRKVDLLVKHERRVIISLFEPSECMV